MLYVFTCLRPHVLGVFTCSRVCVLTCLARFCACVLDILGVLTCLVGMCACVRACALVMMKCFIFLRVCVLGVLFCLIYFTSQYLDLKILTAKNLCALLSWTYLLFKFWYQLVKPFETNFNENWLLRRDITSMHPKIC